MTILKSFIDREEKEMSPRYSLQNYYKSGSQDELHLKVYIKNGKSNKLLVARASSYLMNVNQEKKLTLNYNVRLYN